MFATDFGNLQYLSNMTEYKKSTSEQMGSRLPFCKKLNLKIVEYFENNLFQCKIVKTVNISPPTVHNIKQFPEFEEMFLHKRQGQNQYSMPMIFRPTEKLKFSIVLAKQITPHPPGKRGDGQSGLLLELS